MIYEDERLDEINDSLKLIQKKDGLTFGTDAFLLYAYLRKKRRACAKASIRREEFHGDFGVLQIEKHPPFGLRFRARGRWDKELSS